MHWTEKRIRGNVPLDDFGTEFNRTRKKVARCASAGNEKETRKALCPLRELPNEKERAKNLPDKL